MAQVSVQKISDYLLSSYKGLRPRQSWGETGFFYNPQGTSPYGAYFFTIKEKDGDNDRASALWREGVYRLNFAVTQKTFLELFQVVPKRPIKGGIIKGAYDFTLLDTLTPHPIYGWMKWLAIVSPDQQSWEHIKLLIQESYDLAATKFNKRK